MNWNHEKGEEPSRHTSDNDHDRLVRLEERVSQWMHSVERRLTGHHQTTILVVSLIGTGAVGLVVALLTSGSP